MQEVKESEEGRHKWLLSESEKNSTERE